LVGWNKIDKPKNIGGLGIRLAREANTCLLGKLVWDLVQKNNKLWVNILSDKYTAGPNNFHASVNNNSSPVWSSIIRAKEILKNGYSWRAGSGSSSFWFSLWSDFGILGSQIPIIDIHVLHLTVKDVLTISGNRAQSLYTTLPQVVSDFVNNAAIMFNDAIEDAFVWPLNKSGVYTTKSGYKWLLSLPGPNNNTNMNSWSWIWRLKIPENFKFFIWLAYHNSVPTLSLLNHHNIAPLPTCSRCGLHNETFFHCIRDCKFSRNIWQHMGFTDPAFFDEDCVADWLREGTTGTHAVIFSACLWWVWRCRNSMCLSNEHMSLTRLSANSMSSVKDINLAFSSPILVTSLDRHIRWNNNNFDCAILNVDGSCIGSPVRAGFGGLIRNSAGFFLASFLGFLPSSSDILQAELTAIYYGLSMAKDMGIIELVCYSDSLLSINIINGSSYKFHVYAVLIQEIKVFLSQANYSLHHTLHEGNQCADFLAKLRASSDDIFLSHQFPPDDLCPLLRIDASGTLFLRA